MRYEDVTDIATIRFIHVAVEELVSQARNHSEGRWAQRQGGHIYKQIDHVQLLIAFLEELRDGGARVDGMDFHSHGGPGGIRFGPGEGNQLVWANIRHLDNRNIDQIFKPNAHIAFYGCQVARDLGGEYFLARVGLIFLRSGGGAAKGYRVLGHTHAILRGAGSEEIPDSYDDDAPRDDRSLVTAVVRPNGGIAQIRNARWLTPNITRARVNRIRDLTQRIYGSSYQYPHQRAGLVEDQQFLNRARGQLRGSPTYSTMFNIHRTLDQGLERRVRMLDADLHRRPCHPAHTMRGCISAHD